MDNMKQNIEDIKRLKTLLLCEEGAKSAIKRICLYDEQSYVPNMSSEQTAFRCGMRQVWIEINEILNTDLEKLIENYERDEDDELLI